MELMSGTKDKCCNQWSFGEEQPSNIIIDEGNYTPKIRFTGF